MIVIAVQDGTYPVCLAALEVCMKRALELGGPELAEKFREAQVDLERAYLDAVTSLTKQE